MWQRALELAVEHDDDVGARTGADGAVDQRGEQDELREGGRVDR